MCKRQKIQRPKLDQKKVMLSSRLVSALISRDYFMFSTPMNRKNTSEELKLIKQSVGEGRVEKKNISYN